MSQGGLYLRTFRANDKILLQEIEGTNTSNILPCYATKDIMQDDISYTQDTIGPNQKDNSSKVLEVNWNNENDELLSVLGQIVELEKNTQTL